MNPKTILTEEGWDEVAPDCKGKDKELKKALLFYWSLEDDDFEFRGKALGKIAALAGTLKAANEVKNDRDTTKYLTDVIAATKTKQAELAKAKVEAEKKKVLAAKDALKKAEAEKKEQEEAEQDGEEEADEYQGVDPYKKLEGALKLLKSSKDPYYFLYCKEKPYGLVVSKKNIWQNADAKKELSQMAGGSTTTPKRGRVRREGDKMLIFEFEQDKPVTGMARIVQKWVKDNTPAKLAFKVQVGDESADDEEEQLVAEKPGAGAAPPPRNPVLEAAPQLWNKTRDNMAASIDRLKAAIRKDFAQEGPKMVSDIEKNMKQLDRVLNTLDRKLADSLANANAARNLAARNAELGKAKSLLATHINFVKSDPIIAHIDENPFGVQTDFRKTLTDTFTQMARAIA